MSDTTPWPIGGPSRTRPGETVEARKIGSEARAHEASLEFSYTVLHEAEGSAPKGERRRFTRQRTRLRSGKIIHPGGRFITECLIHNRSASGCRLRLPSAIALPSKICFFDDETERLFQAVVMWQKAKDIGIRLLPHGANELNRAATGRMQRRLYGLRP